MNCGYDSEVWIHDLVNRDDGWDGYYCPSCHHHQLVKSFRVRAELPEGVTGKDPFELIRAVMVDIPNE